MQERTWKYGEVKFATVTHILDNTVVLVDEDGEGHVLVGVDHECEPRQHDHVEMNFCEGGPTGGYWKMVDIVELNTHLK